MSCGCNNGGSNAGPPPCCPTFMPSCLPPVKTRNQSDQGFSPFPVFPADPLTMHGTPAPPKNGNMSRIPNAGPGLWGQMEDVRLGSGLPSQGCCGPFPRSGCIKDFCSPFEGRSNRGCGGFGL